MMSAGMELREWKCNSSATSGDSEVTSVLGLLWDTSNDHIFLQNLKKNTFEPITKRNFLSFISQIFDPVGFLSPIVIIGKILIQRIWKLALKWDDIILDPDLLKEIDVLQRELGNFDSIKIPRCYSLPDTNDISLHVFCDASIHAYSAVVYVVSSSQVSFVVAKTRVAPVKEVTLPKMELLACLIGSRLISKLTHIVPKFQNANCYCWTDSSIALAWITSQPKNNNNRDLFVKNRVNEIQTLTSQMCWRHVSTYDNPADLATRANMTMKSLLDAQIWWNGPPWIILYSFDWPVNTLTSHITENIELINTCAHATNAHEQVIDEPLFDLKRKSRLQIVLRVTAYILRSISKSSLPYGHRTLVTSSGKKVQTPSNEEMSRAKTYWIKWVQQTSFQEELTVLHKQMSVTTRSKLWPLGPTLDANGILVSVGRTHRVLTRNLVILPSASELTRLIILDQHERLFHAGVTLTLSETRTSYWIIRGRQTVKRVIRDCLICKRHKVLPYLQVQSALPEWRIAERPAFSASGIDFCGPFYTKEGKAYILLFTCCCTRAIHLELTRDQSTESVINAYRRFISRRGHCEFIISDNAKSFLRARQDLNSIKWVTIPERSPWWGGFWERLVRSIKTALRRSLGRACLTFEELRTVITEIEAAINLRPITYVSDDRDDPQPLRPIDFILAPESPPVDTLVPNQQLLGRWKHRQATFRNVWKRWKKEYLSELHRWTISDFGQGLPNVGDVVLVDPLTGSNRALFPLGMVTQLIEGRDGRVRAAYVRVNGKTLRRTTRHLFPLETSELPQTDS